MQNKAAPVFQFGKSFPMPLDSIFCVTHLKGILGGHKMEGLGLNPQGPGTCDRAQILSFSVSQLRKIALILQIGLF
mgnify:CR=1